MRRRRGAADKARCVFRSYQLLSVQEVCLAENSDVSHPVRTTSLVLLAILASLTVLYFTRALLVPIMFALLLNAIFRPITRIMERARIPNPIGSAIVVLGLMVLLALLAIELSDP